MARTVCALITVLSAFLSEQRSTGRVPGPGAFSELVERDFVQEHVQWNVGRGRT